MRGVQPKWPDYPESTAAERRRFAWRSAWESAQIIGLYAIAALAYSIAFISLAVLLT